MVLECQPRPGCSLGV
ncbi:hypothetical protein MTR67_034872 [Solanum verrucosum]|uniref:Uncharacterized protein n=1 Tax=Solanum verrucosum TaxID=315347 RepID=A0AAF0U8Y6_SOLVR|nr:hypothetical protein MTR67_034872 [Solanum verrucosum]